MALALDNLKRVDTPLNKETKPNPEMLHFTLDPYIIRLSVKQGRIKYHF